MKTANEIQIIDRAYRSHRCRVLNYISTRVNDRAEAENLAQDVWLRLLSCDKTIEAESLQALIFTVARNLVNDYLRRLYLRQEIGDEMRRTADTVDTDMESAAIARDLARHEAVRVECLPPQRRIIYIMSRYEEMSVEDIAGSLDLSHRTVENHLRMGRRDIRRYMEAAC